MKNSNEKTYVSPSFETVELNVEHSFMSENVPGGGEKDGGEETAGRSSLNPII